ncbi:MAG TPA: DUF2171 domain-containing protein [Ktedonobacteraceae bacterium]|nr:DUF2171 domain-containing protein [Ktedonobacteraceae bacterium]
MAKYSAEYVQTGMHIYTSDNHELGHVAKVYEDSMLVHKGHIFPTDRYIPYSAIESIDNGNIRLDMPLDEAKQKIWHKRPDYEKHLGDPVQLFYDRGHGVHDPFDQADSKQT